MAQKIITKLEQFQFPNYDLSNLQLIGEGTYGKIFKIKAIHNQQYYAAKQIDMKRIKQENQLNSLIQEIQLMKQLENPYLVKLMEYSIGKMFSYIVLQLCDHDLRKLLLNKKSKIGQQKAIQILGEIVKCLKVLVQHSYIHRDLKPDNILIKDNKYKLTDLGFTVKADINCEQKLSQICGTPIYMAPQLLNGQPYTAKCDIWSLGLLFFQLIYGTTPWPVKCISNYRQLLKKRPLAFPFDVRIRKQTKDFLKRTLSIDQQKRMSWKQLFEHDLIKNNFSGEIVIPKQINLKTRDVLSKIQTQSKRKFINVIQVFKNYQQLTALNFPQLESLLKQLNPTITSYQIKVIFQACDKNKNNLIEKKQFKEMFCSVNYQFNPQIQNQIEEIIGIICVKEIQVPNLFEKFDVNNSNSLSFNQFVNMIHDYAPAYRPQSIAIVFQKIDVDHDGLITKKQFVEAIGGQLIHQKNYVGVWAEKALKNIKNLKASLVQQKLSAKNILKIADLNKDKQIDINEFTRLIQIIQFPISKQQIVDIFRVLDSNQSYKISIDQIQDCIQEND